MVLANAGFIRKLFLRQPGAVTRTAQRAGRAFYRIVKIGQNDLSRDGNIIIRAFHQKVGKLAPYVMRHDVSLGHGSKPFDRYGNVISTGHLLCFLRNKSLSV